MPAARPSRPPPRSRVIAPVNGDQVTPMAQRQIADAAQRAANQLRDRAVLTGVTLVLGDNVLNHGLGRKPVGANVTPTTTSSVFAWSFKDPTTTQVTINVNGIGQDNATVEVF